MSLVREMVELPLKFPQLFGLLGIDPPKGVLLTGPPGTGKTLIARAVSSEVRAHFIHVNGPEVIHKFYGESEAKLRQIFEEAQRNAPSIIFLDEFDALAPKRAQVVGDVEKRVVAQLLALMDGLVERGEVVVIGATNMPELVDPALRRPGRFDREIAIGVPDRGARRQILGIHSRRMPLGPDVDLEQIAEITHGYVGADLEVLCKEAGMVALRRLIPQVRFEADLKPQLDALAFQVTREDFLAAFKVVEPTSTREFLAERPRVTFKDIGGLTETKRTLSSILQLVRAGGALFGHTRFNPPKGILLTGASGTGKTLLARALAGELGLTLITVDQPSLLSKWVGESEKGLREVFKRAKQASPCILFFDEIESLVPARSAQEAGSFFPRLVSQLFRELDELHGSLGVVVLGATNRPDLMEPALLRAGRFDYVLELPLPDRDERREILGDPHRRAALGERCESRRACRGHRGLDGRRSGAGLQEGGNPGLGGMPRDPVFKELPRRRSAPAGGPAVRRLREDVTRSESLFRDSMTVRTSYSAYAHRSSAGRWNRSRHRDAVHLQFCVHESLLLGDVRLGEMRETSLQLHVLANRFVLLGFELVPVLSVFPLVHVPHAGLDGEPGDLDRLGFVELPSLRTGGVDVEEGRPLHVQGLAHLVDQVDRIGHRSRGHVLHRRVAADDELRRVLGEQRLALGDRAAREA